MPLSPDWVCRACGHQFPTPRREWGKNVENMRCPLCLAVSDPILRKMTDEAKSSALARKIVSSRPQGRRRNT